MNKAAAPVSALATYARLLRYAKRYRGLLLMSAVGMIIEAAAGAGFVRLMQPMVDETFVAKNPDVRWTLPLIIVGLFIARGIATYISDYGMALAGRSVVRDLRVILLGKFLGLPSGRFDREPVAAMVSRLNFDAEQVAQASSDALKVMLTDSLTIIGLLVVMFMVSAKVTVALMIMAPLIAGISVYVGKRYRRINRQIQEGVGDLAQSAEEILAAQQEVKLYGKQAAETSRYAELAQHNLQLNLKVETTRALASSIVQLLGAIGLAALLIIAGYDAAQGGITAGGFVSLMTAMMALIPSLKRIANVQNIINKGIAASERIFSVIDEADEPDFGAEKLARAAGRIEFRQVDVRYANQVTRALDDVSFTAEPGTVTAIVGRSGSGKSTLIRTLPRFYEPAAGVVLIDDVPVQDYQLADLRRQIALVGQKVMLFDDTIAANIAYGAVGDVEDADILRAAEMANALEFIERLPLGMQTVIGENGALLSGGQRQRLAIARAVLKNAPILILDEATAALDNESERLIQQALERLIPDRTTLVIAHRLSTIEHADQVLVMDQGKIVERGRHSELLAKGGVYAYLHRMQFRDTATIEAAHK